MNIIKKIIWVVIGSVIAAFGIDLAIYAGFGGATLAVLWQGVSRVLHITLGQASFMVSVGMIVFCLFYDRSQIYLGTILYQIIYSVCTDLFQPLMHYTETKILNFFMMLMGIVLFAVGTAIYSYADWGRGSYEAVTFALAKKHSWQIKYVRIALDAMVVLFGMFLGGKFGICTICTILLSGVMIQKTLQLLYGKELAEKIVSDIEYEKASILRKPVNKSLRIIISWCRYDEDGWKGRKMNFRLMQISDYDSIYNLWINTPGMGLNSVDDSKEGIEKFLKRNPATCFVAEEDSKIVGVIMAGNDGRRGYIYHTAVLPEFRGKHVAKTLVENAMAALEKERITKVALVVFEKNKNGNSFWEKIGFTVRNDLIYRNKTIVQMERIDT